MTNQAQTAINLYPDDVSADQLTRTLARRKMSDCELRRVRLGTQSLRTLRWYAIEVWGVYRNGEYLGFFKRHGRSNSFHFWGLPDYGYTFVGEATHDTTQYSNQEGSQHQ